MGNDADSHELLSVVAAVHHQRVGEPLDDGALRLAEPLHRVSTGGVRDVDWLADLDVVTVSCLLVSNVLTSSLPTLFPQSNQVH